MKESSTTDDKATVQLVILGSGAFAQEVADVASDIAGIEIAAFVEGRNRERCEELLLGLQIL